jgi:hypothetical protein
MCLARSGNVREKHTLQGIIYLSCGGFFCFVTVQTIMLWVWGVKPHPLTYLGFLSSFGFIAAGVISICITPQYGRIVAACALAGLTPLWVIWVTALVPEHNTIPLPLLYLAVAAYVAVLGVVAFLPRPVSLAITGVAIVCGLGVAIAAFTYAKRLSVGEYNRPGVGCFRWYHDQGRGLLIARDTENWINTATKVLIEKAGIEGRLQLTGGWGIPNSPTRVIVLAQNKPSGPVQLHYPQKGVLVYAFDGISWRKIPADAPTYPTFFTLENGNDSTMLYEELSDGSRQGTEVFIWKRE